jgi:diguanylate cyclase (GGDEF)-like protein
MLHLPRPRLRWVVVVVAVALLVVTQLVGFVLSGINAENTALSVARDSIRREGDTTIESILRHLEPAEQSANVTARLLGEGLLATDDHDLSRYLYTQLTVMPQMTGAFIGYPDGSFTFVNRTDEGFRAKQIDVVVERTVTVRHLDPAFAETSVEYPTDDTFDPRQRPWYELATAADQLVWTDPYVFFSSGKPGVTASRAVRDGSGAVRAVVGVDVELSGLTEFLDQLAVSEHGEAFVVSGDDVVAAASRYTSQSQVDGDGTLRLITTEELGIGELLGSTSAGRAGGVRLVEESDQRQLVLHAAFPAEHGLDWGLVIRAPQSDFTEAVREQRRTLLLIWLVGAILVGISALVLARVTRPMKTLQHLAATDPLTGIANRRRVTDVGAKMVAEARRQGTLVAVVAIDLDGFKALNDRRGHAAGDQALQAVGAELSALTGGDDLIGRIGGDEFVVVSHVSTERQAIALAERIVSGLSERLSQRAPEVLGLGASAGISVGGLDDTEFDELLRRADAALLERKVFGKGSLGLAAGSPRR